MTTSTIHPHLSGLWAPTPLEKMIYGPEAVQKHLRDCLPSEKSKAFIVTGSSLAKTPLIKQVEELLGGNHAGTFTKIRAHAPVADLDGAMKEIQSDSAVDTVISVGGGSPIDSAKALSDRLGKQTGKFLYHITIPTTLSAAECTLIFGTTDPDGTKKTTFGDRKAAVSVIIYDSKFGLETPEHLFLSTGIRALDHAVELMYNPTSTEVPTKPLALSSIKSLFEYLPKYKANPRDEEVITRCFITVFSSLMPLGTNVIGGIGLSHALGYALGSPYGIPHGVTSCLTLSKVVKLKTEDPNAAEQIARILPFVGGSPSQDTRADAIAVGDAISELVKKLGLATNLKEWKVGEDQVGKIVKLGTGGKEPGDPLYSKVEELVKTLW